MCIKSWEWIFQTSKTFTKAHYTTNYKDNYNRVEDCSWMACDSTERCLTPLEGLHGIESFPGWFNFSVIVWVFIVYLSVTVVSCAFVHNIYIISVHVIIIDLMNTTQPCWLIWDTSVVKYLNLFKKLKHAFTVLVLKTWFTLLNRFLFVL